MTISQALSQATKKLKLSKIPSAPLDAEILLSFTLKKEREYLFSHPEHKLTPIQIKKYNALIGRRIKHEPAAYLVGKKQFFGLDFYVNKDVLIPRPETELIIEEAAKIAKKEMLIIIDVGTGSGCVAVALAKVASGNQIYAVDIAPKALAVASRNAHLHKVKIKFLKGNLLHPLPLKIWRSKRQKLILTNLPYLEQKYQKKLNTPVNKGLVYEPHQALFGGRDGLKYYRQFFQQLRDRIRNHKSRITVIIEINPRQDLKIRKIVRTIFPKAKIKIKKDLAGLNRIAVIQTDRRKPIKMRSYCESATIGGQARA